MIILVLLLCETLNTNPPIIMLHMLLHCTTALTLNCARSSAPSPPAAAVNQLDLIRNCSLLD